MGFNQLLNNEVTIKEKPLPLFKEYLETGYYPFFLEDNYHDRLANTINLTLEIDIPLFTDMNMSTARKLKQLLFILAESVLFKSNLTKIGELIGAHRNQVAEYLVFFRKSWTIKPSV